MIAVGRQRLLHAAGKPADKEAVIKLYDLACGLATATAIGVRG
jgi:hypothetical protein